MIVVSKVNDVYIHVDADRGIQAELSDFFTFQVPGYQFTPQYRSRVWDGKIRLYSYATGKIFAGLLPYIRQFAKDKNIEYFEAKDVESINNIKKEEVIKFVDSLKPQSRGKPLEIRDYQYEAIYSSIKYNRNMILSPTASGKSLIIYSLIRFYRLLLKKEKNNKILIIVPTTSLVEQMYSDFKDYGWNVTNYCQKIYQGFTKEAKKEVVISTWQSIYKMPKSFFKDFGCVLGDEAHLFKAKSLMSIMTKLEQCKFRTGLTGTLDGTKTHKLVLEGLFGVVNKVTSTKTLMDKKQLAKLSVKCLVLKHTQQSREYIKNKSYQEEVDYLVRNETRNNFVKNLCLDLQGNTLCLFQFVEKHGEVLYNLLKDSPNKKVFFIHGGVETDERERVRGIVEKSDNVIIIASYGTFSTGVNIRNLHNLVFAFSGKSRIRHLQSIGRSLRLGDNKTDATMYDITDDLSIGENKNYTLQHFLERINIYNEEQFDYEIHNVELKK